MKNKLQIITVVGILLTICYGMYLFSPKPEKVDNKLKQEVTENENNLSVKAKARSYVFLFACAGVFISCLVMLLITKKSVFGVLALFMGVCSMFAWMSLL